MNPWDWLRAEGRPVTIRQFMAVVAVTAAMSVGLVGLIDASVKSGPVVAEVHHLNDEIKDLQATIAGLQTQQDTNRQRIAELEAEADALSQQVVGLGGKPVVDVRRPTVNSGQPSATTTTAPRPRPTTTTTTTEPARPPPTTTTTACLVSGVPLPGTCR